MDDAAKRKQDGAATEGRGLGGVKARAFLVGLLGMVAGPGLLSAQDLPDAPGMAVVQQAGDGSAQKTLVPETDPSNRVKRPPCPAMSWAWREQKHDGVMTPCEPENQMQLVLSTAYVRPLTPKQKGELAAREVIDPFNAITIIGASGINIAADSHTAYGPGLKGWGRLTGYSYLEDATGVFFGTFLIPSLAEEDPRYHRMPGKPIRQRLLHVVAHSVISQHDDGSPMPNYSTILTYPIINEIANLYVPGIQPNATSTGKRIALGYATDPISNLVDEFLPDVAKHIHIHIVFVQQIINRAAAGQSL